MSTIFISLFCQHFVFCLLLLFMFIFILADIILWYVTFLCPFEYYKLCTNNKTKLIKKCTILITVLNQKFGIHVGSFQYTSMYTIELHSVKNILFAISSKHVSISLLIYFTFKYCPFFSHKLHDQVQ